MSRTGEPSRSSSLVSLIRPITFADPDHASSIISSAYADVCIEPLTPGAFDMASSGVAMQGVQIYHSQSASGVRFTRVGQYNGYSFSSLHSGKAVFTVGTGRHEIADGMNVSLDARTVDKLELGQNSTFVGLAVTAATLQEALSVRIGRQATRRLSFQEDHHSPEKRNAYLSICDVLMSGLGDEGHLRDNPLAVASLRESLINMILFGSRHNYSELIENTSIEDPATVRRAIEYMYAHAHLPITTTDVARDLGIGIRSLQLSFQRWQETTPHHYLRHIRLKLARQDLLDGAQVNVGPVSKKWGFNSTGQFARLYKNAFGELPVQTLSARGRYNSLG